MKSSKLVKRANVMYGRSAKRAIRRLRERMRRRFGDVGEKTIGLSPAELEKWRARREQLGFLLLTKPRSLGPTRPRGEYIPFTVGGSDG